MKKEKLSINKIKKIAHEIIDTELADIPHYTFPMTFIEYNKNFPFNNQSKLKLIKDIKDKREYKRLSGTNYTYSNTILIALDNFTNFKNSNISLIKLVLTCYHEARHTTQLLETEYTSFFSNLDMFIANQEKRKYNTFHDKFFHEIDANVYSVKQAKKYLKEKYPEVYNTEYNYLNTLEQKYELDNIMYNANDSIDTALKIIQKEQKIPEECKEILKVFVNDNGTFKPMNEIISNPEFYKLDSRIISAFLSSKTFLQNINLETLSKKELQIINIALNHTNQIHEKQKNFLERSLSKKIISQVEYQESIKSTYHKFTFFLACSIVNFGEEITKEIKINKKIKTKEQNIDNINKLIKSK